MPEHATRDQQGLYDHERDAPRRRPADDWGIDESFPRVRGRRFARHDGAVRDARASEGPARRRRRPVEDWGADEAFEDDRHEPAADERHQAAGLDADGRHEVAGRVADERHQAAGLDADGRHEVAGRVADERHQAAGLDADGRHEVAGRVADERHQAAGLNADGRHEVAGRVADGRHEATGLVTDGRHDPAALAAGHEYAPLGDEFAAPPAAHGEAATGEASFAAEVIDTPTPEVVRDGRRTIRIHGRPGELSEIAPFTSAARRRRPPLTVEERLAGNPTRIIAWAFLLGLLLILIAVLTS